MGMMGLGCDGAGTVVGVRPGDEGGSDVGMRYGLGAGLEVVGWGQG